MRSGEHDVARAYVLYREKRAAARAPRRRRSGRPPRPQPVLHVVENGASAGRSTSRALTELRRSSACEGLGDGRRARRRSSRRRCATCTTACRWRRCASRRSSSARALIEKDPGLQLRHGAAAAAHHPPRGAGRGGLAGARWRTRYAEYFPQFIAQRHRGRAASIRRLATLRPRAGWAARCDADRDLQVRLPRAADALRPLLPARATDRRIELPQAFFMRVAMGLALNEMDREARAIEFYDVLSTLRLHELDADAVQRRHAALAALELLPDHGVRRPRRASTRRSRRTRCSPSTPAAWATTGRRCARSAAHIKGTNGKSQGVVPFLKVVNDTAVAVNQGGKRKGAVCSYLETWHLDIEEFLELRKNTGDDRRRTHDMNTANWIPDLFMKRVMENARVDALLPRRTRRSCTTGTARPSRRPTSRYEDKAARGELKLYKKIPAVQLWRKMLSMLFETGHPWITFKDPCNLRSPQQHVGVVHSSNLCTEITLNTAVRRDRGVQPGLGQPGRAHAQATAPSSTSRS